MGRKAGRHPSLVTSVPLCAHEIVRTLYEADAFGGLGMLRIWDRLILAGAKRESEDVRAILRKAGLLPAGKGAKKAEA